MINEEKCLPIRIQLKLFRLLGVKFVCFCLFVCLLLGVLFVCWWGGGGGSYIFLYKKRTLRYGASNVCVSLTSLTFSLDVKHHVYFSGPGAGPIHMQSPDVQSPFPSRTRCEVNAGC